MDKISSLVNYDKTRTILTICTSIYSEQYAVFVVKIAHQIILKSINKRRWSINDDAAS